MIEVLPFLYASSFSYHLGFAVGPRACIFMKLLIKVKESYRSRPNVKKTGQYFQDEAPATYL